MYIYGLLWPTYWLINSDFDFQKIYCIFVPLFLANQIKAL